MNYGAENINVDENRPYKSRTVVLKVLENY